MKRLLRAPLVLARRLAFLRWTLAMRARLAWAGMRLELDAPHEVKMAGSPRLEVETGGQRGGTVRIKIGRAVRIGAGVELQVHAGYDNELELDDHASVASGARFKLRDGAIRVGEAVAIRDFVVLKSAGQLTIGPRSTLSYGAVIHCEAAVTLEEGVGVADRATIVDSEHRFDGRDLRWSDFPLEAIPIVLGRYCAVGPGTTVRAGAILEPGCLAAPSSSVGGGRHPAYTIIAGTPAKVIKRLREPDSA